ncbi:hypothetical protein [Chromohalobacter sp. 48-RD10]|uniref:hypothetical protein n=1 Tax=Chromohalobacter sp. 48-RD10 TaxID=2994063 RepID=UPI002469015E|nr:hypothetical protein [Chromohalobacter sp. 48-RD10]
MLRRASQALWQAVGQWLRAKKTTRERLPVVVCGLEYAHYRLLTHFARSTRYRALAVVDDYPWHHGTQVEGIRIYYPSEVPSLVERHGVTAVVYCHEGELAVFADETRERLATWGVPCVRLSPDDEDIDAELTGWLTH